MTNPIKKRIQAGETLTACWADLGSHEACEIIVHAGWDIVLIDCEHGAAPLEEGLSMIRAVEAAGGQAILRVPDGSDTTLKRALDRGARSILVPMVNTPDAARAIAASCRYPGRGGRGYAAPIVRASGYGARVDYAKQAHDDLFLMVQCEHVDAVPHLAEIGAIEGIDGVFIGPNDLVASMGHLEELEHPDLIRVKSAIEDEARAKGILLSTITGGGRDWAQLRDAGYRIIVGPNDVAMLFTAARKAHQDMVAQLGGTSDMTAARTY